MVCHFLSGVAILRVTAPTVDIRTTSIVAVRRRLEGVPEMERNCRGAPPLTGDEEEERRRRRMREQFRPRSNRRPDRLPPPPVAASPPRPRRTATSAGPPPPRPSL
jgi:hypothetical protein